MASTTAVLISISILAMGACAPTTAVVHGTTLPRVALGFTDHQTYALRHTNAYPEPRGPSSGLRSYGGQLDGSVCGVDVMLDAEYYGRFMSVTGFVEPTVIRAGPSRQLPLQIEARDQAGERVINGSFIGDNFAVGIPGFDFKFSNDHLRGSVGLRSFDLTRDGDDRLSGTMTMASYTYPFVLDGIDEVWRMPVADQAVLLPLMLSCRYKYAVDVQSPYQTVPMLTLSFRDRVR